jgi:hypothetical protein
MNLFLGIIFYNFKATGRAARLNQLTDSQQTWVDLVNLVGKTSSDEKSTIKKITKINSICSSLLTRGILKYVVLAFSGISLLPLILWKTNYWEKNMELISYFTFVTISLNLAEAFIKIFAAGPRLFLTQPWNVFDILIILISSLEIFPILFDLPLEINDFLSALGVLRIFRFLTLFPQHSGVKSLLTTFAYSFPIVFNFFILLLLILFIYSMAGYILFSDLELENDIHFHNFFLSLVTLLKVATGDEWVSIMIQVKKANGQDINFFLSNK